MSEIYFWILVGSLAATLSVVLYKPEKIYEYPYFMAATFAVFIVPQAFSLMRFPGGAKPVMITNVMLMSCLCFGGCWLGYLPRAWRPVQKFFSSPVDINRLFHGGLVFMAASFYFNHLISQMTDEEKGGSMWTGKVTIYGFFGDLIYPAFAIALTSALRKGDFFSWVITIMCGIGPIEAAIFAARREHFVQFILTLVLTLYYQKKIKPPRLLILGSIILAMLAIPATGSYRAIASEGDWERVHQIDLIGNFKDYFNQESILELRNAAFEIEAVRTSGAYEYGKGYSDQLVFRFVPAQIVGKAFKDSLMFHPSEERMFAELYRLGYVASNGSTTTGMADAFQQFGWFGFLFFAFIAIMYKSIYYATLQPDAMFAQLFYILICTSAMRAVTHQTIDFFPGVVYYGIFLGLLFLYARIPPGRARRRGR